jgi:hypothetical protein
MMGSGEFMCKTTESSEYSRRKTQCNQIWEWDCGSAEEQHQEMCYYYEWFGWESWEDSKNAIHHTGSNQ